MPISVEQIDLWRQLPKESEVLEFKEAKNQYDTQKLLEYCVAIGNEGGGHLILGIRNKNPRIVVGTKAVDDPGGMSEKIFNTLGFHRSCGAIHDTNCDRSNFIQNPGLGLMEERLAARGGRSVQ